jgi:hypothetical protein
VGLASRGKIYAPLCSGAELYPAAGTARAARAARAACALAARRFIIAIMVLRINNMKHSVMRRNRIIPISMKQCLFQVYLFHFFIAYLLPGLIMAAIQSRHYV